MKTEKYDDGSVKLWLSTNDTYRWANKIGAYWPCSFLSDKRLFAKFAGNGDLVDMAVNGGRGNQDCPADEFNAITTDFLKGD